jgi:putative acetyltransferase
MPDRDEVRNVYLSAFAEDERKAVSELACSLLVEETIPETISLVAEVDGVIAAHVAFSPVVIVDDESFQGYILSPLGVRPAYQRRGFGSQLIESGKQALSGKGVDILFVYGDPKYYCKFGFSADVARAFLPPYKLQYSFGWQGLALSEKCTERPPGNMTCVTSLCDPALW